MLLSNFKSKFSDFIRMNLYQVHIITPFAPSKYANDSLTFLCRDATFPFYTLNTQTNNYNNINHLYGTDIDFDPANFIFHMDNTNKAFSFFKDWNEFIIDKDKLVEFKNNYAGTIHVEVYDLKGIKKLSVTLWDAFPINIENMNLSYTSTDEVLTMSISFAFDDVTYEINNNTTPSIDYKIHMNNRLRQWPKPYNFEYPWSGVYDSVKGFAEGILGKQLTHQLEKKAKNKATQKINKKAGINAIPNSKKMFNLGGKTVSKGISGGTVSNASRMFK